MARARHQDDAAGSAQSAAGTGLVIFPGALGDLICFAPALRAVARRHNLRRVDLVARSDLAVFACGRLGVARGYGIERRELARLFASDTQQSELDEFFGRYVAIYSFFASDNHQFRRNLTRVSRGRARFFPFHPPGTGHRAGRYLKLIGERRLDRAVQLSLQPEDFASAAGELSKGGISPGGYLLLLPGSGSGRKNWPLENFFALALEQTSLQPAALLGPAEAGLEAAFAQRNISVFANLDVATAAALARLGAAFVGNDSGLSHLAAAAGAPGVVLFGPTDPDEWRPLGKVVVLRREPLDRLSPVEVADALACLLKGAGKATSKGRTAGLERYRQPR